MSLKQERAGVVKNLAQTENRMSEIAQEFADVGGVCCPACWSREYSDLLQKQQRREQRIKEIDAKLLGRPAMCPDRISLRDVIARLPR